MSVSYNNFLAVTLVGVFTKKSFSDIAMDETVPFLKHVVDLLRKAEMDNKIKIIIGGRAVSEQTRSKYGIDAYGKDAWDGVKKVEDLLSSLKTCGFSDQT